MRSMWMFSVLVGGCAARAGLRAGIAHPPTNAGVETDLVKQNLFAELHNLGRGPRAQRLERITDAFHPMYAALPKTGERKDGLEEKVVRYALHRFFMQQYGWHVKGLGVHGDRWDSSTPDILQKGFAPSYIVSLVEQGLKGRGVNLHELAVLAATIQDLVHAENHERLLAAYVSHDIAPQTDDEVMMGLVQDTYLALLFQNIANFSALSAPVVRARLNDFRQNSRWPELKGWIADTERALQDKVREKTNLFGKREQGFAKSERFAEEVVQQFGPYEDASCRSMKEALLDLEDVPGSGRIRLGRFYKAKPISGWMFTEPLEYLRTQAAVDETDPDEPTIVIPNYVYLKANCLNPSPLYGICCMDQCAPLMRHVEKDVAAPTATPQRLLEIVAQLASETVAAPRNLSALLQTRLTDVAAHHDGEVPLHGRLFAQWMHHAFPAECAFPHTPGNAPELMSLFEWTAAAPGRKEVNLTEYAGEAGAADLPTHAEEENRVATFEPAGLPWSTEEELVAAELEHAPRVELHAKSSSTKVLRGLALVAAVACSVASLRQKFLFIWTGGKALPLHSGGLDGKHRPGAKVL